VEQRGAGSSTPPALAAGATASPARHGPGCARAAVVAKQLLHSLGALGFSFSSFFSFLQNFVNEAWVDLGSETDGAAQQESGRIEVLEVSPRGGRERFAPLGLSSVPSLYHSRAYRLLSVPLQGDPVVLPLSAQP